MLQASLPAFLATHPDAILVEVAEAKGSTPREAGAFMLVTAEHLLGTIGGGQLEFLAIEHARRMLAAGDTHATLDVPLGPEIGQCCGGRTELSFRRIDAELRAALLARQDAMERGYPDVFVFGAGHVGAALAQALSPLPLTVTVIETRDLGGDTLPAGIALRRVAVPEAEVATIRSGGAAVILTHDHALDFLIARQALARSDLRYVGMIGSATKRATFARFLTREDAPTELIDRLILPIGGTGLRDKRPAVIAALVAAELLTVLLG